MNFSERNQKQLRDWILFICGIIWMSYFSFLAPLALSPQLTVIVATALFGPSVVNVWRGSHKKDGMNDDDDTDDDKSG